MLCITFWLEMVRGQTLGGSNVGDGSGGQPLKNHQVVVVEVEVAMTGQMTAVAGVVVMVVDRTPL